LSSWFQSPLSLGLLLLWLLAYLLADTAGSLSYSFYYFFYIWINSLFRILGTVGMFDGLFAIACVVLFKIVFFYDVSSHKSYEVFYTSPAVVSFLFLFITKFRNLNLFYLFIFWLVCSFMQAWLALSSLPAGTSAWDAVAGLSTGYVILYYIILYYIILYYIILYYIFYFILFYNFNTYFLF
jgi:hypothetical protein